MLICLALAADPAPLEAQIQLTAGLGDAELKVDEAQEFSLKLVVPEDFALPKGRRMKHSPILQIEVPESVALEGKHLKSYREQARNEFLEAPFERLIQAGTTKVGFRLKSKPKADDAIGIIVTAFFRSKSTDKEFFLRRRLSLPLTPGAVAVPAKASNSSRSGTSKSLKIGDRVSDFTLPKIDGSGELKLSDYVGKKKLIITTYRASW